ncbi:hypothetical protein BG006_006153 [Podila minutissima]|uniref:Uncharacterized protein n=1 Tax=Podila minutissima TaxID=64525 RepID=A0A9P5SSV2_9FUNG|nr:hypothetical protein BG006_006153 [Podila minutissima]
MSNITNTKNDLIKGTSWSNPIQLDSDKGDKKNPGGCATILNNNNNTSNATSNSSQGSTTNNVVENYTNTSFLASAGVGSTSHTVDHHTATTGRKTMGFGLDKEDEDESEDDEDKENRQWPKSHFIRSPAPEPEEQV